MFFNYSKFKLFMAMMATIFWKTTAYFKIIIVSTSELFKVVQELITKPTRQTLDFF